MRLKPAIQELKEEFNTLTWTSVDIRNDPTGITQKFGISTIPALAVVSANGVEKHSGSDVSGYYRILKNATR